MNPEKLEDIYVPKMPTYNKLLQTLHKYYKMRDTCISLQPIVQTV